MPTKTLICDCNRTMPLDTRALAQTLAQTPGASADGLETTHTLLCRREAPAFQRAVKATGPGDRLLVACTQESALLTALAQETAGAVSLQERPIQFVNLRETAGWSRQAKAATPKMAALIAAAQLPTPAPVAAVSYRSAGRCLVIGGLHVAQQAAALLAERLEVSVLVDTGASGVDSGALNQRHDLPVFVGRLTQLRGWLGAFEVQWSTHNPIDLELCTRCNACVTACPEGAIGLNYQVDLRQCQGHRACVQACDMAGAIDFNRPPLVTEERFDVVLDLRESPAFTQHQPPQGYFHVPSHRGADPRRWMEAILALREMVGEFDKPKFFHYEQRLCAHSRHEQIGCQACVDICSTRAIRSEASRKGRVKTEQAGGIVVEPHLCAGCGACTTVCPSGALSFAYPGPADQGRRLQQLLSTYQRAGGREAALLLHSEQAGQRLIDELGRAAQLDPGIHGVPARVLPVALWHTASVGLDLWLAAIAQGASQVWVLLTAEEAPEYRVALAEQMAVAQAILTGLGYAGEHVRLIEARDARDLATVDQALQAPAAQGVRKSTALAAQPSKRVTLDMMIDHLAVQAPQPTPLTGPHAQALALPPAGSPFGTVHVDTDKCTLCLSCVGACPQNALLDNPDKPQLRLTEQRCVQCGLCERTCPEQAITLQPRLWLADEGRARRQPRVLHEVEPYRCIRCAKPFGTLKLIENMVLKLGSHPAFQGAAAQRLKMCGDCRVIDLHTSTTEVQIQDVPRR